VDQPVPCCHNPATLTDGLSPFGKILALGLYDGPTSGILECSACSAVYRFDMLDWDDDHEVRIFRLAALPADSLTRCVRALAQAEQPRWPLWVPSRPNLPSEEARRMADREIERILENAKPAELVIAWAGYGETILAARRVPATDLEKVPDWFSRDDSFQEPDWFSLLGLARSKEVA